MIKMTMNNKITGAEAMLQALIAEKVDTVFAYPGGSIIKVFDALYGHRTDLRQILVRHEQGATHAAQGYARVSGRTGVAIVTSGPGATNTITGISDAMLDSTPIVVIAGQGGTDALGTDVELSDTPRRGYCLGSGTRILYCRFRPSGSRGA